MPARQPSPASILTFPDDDGECPRIEFAPMCVYSRDGTKEALEVSAYARRLIPAASVETLWETELCRTQRG